jgi:hypothetical protein
VYDTPVAGPARVDWQVREVVRMSATSVTQQDRHHPASSSSARTLTLAAYLVNLTYLAWFWVMFMGGYWVASWFGIDPVEESITDQGVLGWLAAIGLGLVAALPSLVGVLLAVRAKRAGAGTAATVALVINLMVPIGWIALQVLLA